MTPRKMLDTFASLCNFTDYEVSENDYFDFLLDYQNGTLDPYIDRVKERINELNNNICYYGWNQEEEENIKELEQLLRELYKKKKG